MGAQLLFIHGRDQASPRDVAADPARLREYVAAKKRNWLAGLSAGLVLAGADPVGEADVAFPFYGNRFREIIEDYESNGGRRPELEIADPRDAREKRLVATKSATLLDAAEALGFDRARELSYTDPDLAAQVHDRAAADELGWGDVLRIPVFRSALQYLSRKTGVPAEIIERFLTDVAYYLEFDEMRESVLQIVETALHEQNPNGAGVVVVGHSLGSVVAYDLLTRLPADAGVRLFVTAGSPLGFPVVQKNLRGKEDGRRPRVPALVPARAAGWLNAYDVRDFVSLVHPIADTYERSEPRQIVDLRVFNPTFPHSISDYLSDPDVAGPIGRALRAA